MSSAADDLLPRPLPKPSQIEEIPVRSEVPEVSLVFDSVPRTKVVIIPPLENPSAPKDDHHFARINRIAEADFPKSSSSVKAPLKHEDVHVNQLNKRVSFSPCSSRTEMPKQYHYASELDAAVAGKTVNQDNFRIYNGGVDRINYGPNNHAPSMKSFNEHEFCHCTRGDKEQYDTNTYTQMFKNMDKVLSSKVSFDDLQKTELKYENLLLRYQFKYDKLQENFVSKEEMNTILQKYETQMNILYRRIDELTEKLHYSQRYGYEKSLKKCSCDEYASHSCKFLSRENVPEAKKCCNFEGYKNTDSTVDKQMCFNSEQYSVPSSYRIRNHEEPHCRKEYDMRKMPQYRNPPTESVKTDPKQKCLPLTLPKEYLQSLIVHEQSKPHEQYVSNEVHREVYRNDEPMIKGAEKNLRIDWALYNNIIENVKKVMEQNPVNLNSAVDPVNLIKKATMEQLQKLGISIENNAKEHAKNPETENKVPKNAIPSPDLSFHMNGLAMKYITDNQPPEGEINKKTPTANDVSIRSNYNNVSIATLQYMERYQLFPTSEHRPSDNGTGRFNKYDENISQDCRYTTNKQSQNNDRSFVH